MSEHNIRESDIERFFKTCEKLNELIESIREYVPSAHIYVTPNEINLMVGYGDCTNEKDAEERVIASNYITALDCGDW